jgi:hypothetical protein
MDKQTSKLLASLEYAVTDIVNAPVTEADMPDVTGLLRFSEVRLADTRRGILAEAPDWQKGDRYQIVTSRPNERSYNEPGIFTVTQEIGVSWLDLVNAGVLSLKWNWTKLKSFFEAHDLELRVVHHELRDDEKVPDGPHVGEYKAKARTSVQAIPPEELGL